MFRYYLTQRPPMIGTFPKPKDNAMVAMESFDERRLVPMLHSQAWGYVEYEKPLEPKDIRTTSCVKQVRSSLTGTRARCFLGR